MTNSAQIHEFSFEPMLKYFMVWDRAHKTFRVNNNDGTRVFDVAALIGFFMYQSHDGVPHTAFDLIQFTNLFDKDGKEIFEGSIIKCDYGKTKVVKAINGGLNEVTVIGHILSNPELMEGK